MAGNTNKNDYPKPTSPSIPLTKLIYAASKFLPTNKINFLKRVYNNLMENTISREQMVGYFRKLVGDRLILAAIGLHNNKKMILAPRSRL